MTYEVAVTGVGLVSSLGNSYPDVIQKLMSGCSGISAVPHWVEFGVDSLVAGTVSADLDDLDLDYSKARIGRVINGPVLYNLYAAKKACDDAGLGKEDFRSSRVICIVGSSTLNVSEIFKDHERFFRERGYVRHPHAIFNYMGSTSTAVISSILGITGANFAITSACAGSSHSIGIGFQLVRNGFADCAIVGGGDEVNELVGMSFQALRTALSTSYNEQPAKASRPFDAERDGMVLSGGSGIIVLERRAHAKARKARIRGYLVGYGASGDAFDLFRPLPDGSQAARCMQAAIEDARLSIDDIGYINAHATSTIHGDRSEVRAIRQVFGNRIPPVSSTKAMTGHSNGACGAHEAIFSLAALEKQTAPPSINLDRVDPEFEDVPFARDGRAFRKKYVMSNSFGFGGSNATLVFGM
ncbi:MAG: beta-ketoacyl-[acyl-carrier-protein] synthase family protein [Salaquimonas sp.]|nr:beta-ketoacyl-[acyl-carrier-protein] synthase family protein [Salaquimonas sp.]